MLQIEISRIWVDICMKISKVILNLKSNLNSNIINELMKQQLNYKDNKIFP